MATNSPVPRGSAPSMASYMLGLKLKDKDEKAMMVRIGVLLDAVANSQRGHGNAGAALNRKATKKSRHTPVTATGTTENVFNGVSVVLEPLSSSPGLSNFEVQIDDNAGFSHPTSKKTFSTSLVFKGLDESVTYYIRVRAISKMGNAGPWNNLDPVTTTPSVLDTGATFDGFSWTEGYDSFSPYSVPFTFNYRSESLFAMTCNNDWLRTGFTQTTDNGDVLMATVQWYPAGTPTHNTIQQKFFCNVSLADDTSGVTYTKAQGINRLYPLLVHDIFNPSQYIPGITVGQDHSGQPFTPFTDPYPNEIDQYESSVSGSGGWPVVWIKF